MKASPLLISWHNDNLPIYSVHFEPHGKGRLATAGGDNNVRLWKVERDGEERSVTYLTTLMKVSRFKALNAIAKLYRSIPKRSMSSGLLHVVGRSLLVPMSNG